MGEKIAAHSTLLLSVPPDTHMGKTLDYNYLNLIHTETQKEGLPWWCCGWNSVLPMQEVWV